MKTMIVMILLVMSGCASIDYEADIAACHTDTECENAWAAWVEYEDRQAAREARERVIRQCNDSGGIVLTEQVGAKVHESCVSRDELRRSMQ